MYLQYKYSNIKNPNKNTDDDDDSIIKIYNPNGNDGVDDDGFSCCDGDNNINNTNNSNVQQKLS